MAKKLTAAGKAIAAKIAKLKKKLAAAKKAKDRFNTLLDKLEKQACDAQNSYDDTETEIDRLEDDIQDLEDTLGYDHKALPEKGKFIAYKKAYLGYNSVLVTLEVPADAKRHTPLGEKKSRVSKALVKDITDLHNTNKHYKTAVSNYTSEKTGKQLRYTVGKVVKPDAYTTPREGLVCTNGIHCYKDAADARGH